MSAGRVLVEIPTWSGSRGQVEFAQEVERLGFAGVTLAEVDAPDAFVVLGLVAAETERISLATAVVQCGVRTIPSMAASSATLDEISGGRFRLGLGVSSEAIVSGWHGREWQSPLRHAEESVDLLRRILAGEKSAYDGRVLFSHGFQLPRPAEVPVQLAALNEGMVRLAGRTADGVWLNYLPRPAAAKVVDLIDGAAAEAGRAAPAKLLTCLLEVTDDPAAVRAQIRDFLAFYMASPAYRRALAWHGFADEMAEAARLFEVRDREGVKRCVTDTLIDSIALVGTATEVRDRIEEYFASGIDEVSVGLLNRESAAESLAAAVGAQR